MAYLRAFAETTAGETGSPIRFVASTEGIKRDGAALRYDRWLLDNYQRNPVVLWAHDYSGRTLPIGRAGVMVDTGRRALLADVTFDQADDFARQVEAKYRGGFLHAVSVGWNNLKQGGDTWHELLDISAVPVPGDPDALAERQLRALQEFLHDETPDGEPSWAQTAGAMLRLFAADGDDDERRTRYNALMPAYRRYGKTAPEWLDGKTLRALTTAQLHGLFVSGEIDIAGEWAPAARIGAVLSTANRRDLEQAIGLIQGVMDRAQKPEDASAANAERVSEQARLTQLQNLFFRTQTRII